MEHGERQQRRRFVFLTALFAGCIGFLVLYLFWLQIVKGFEFKQRAKDVSQREVPIPRSVGRSSTAISTTPSSSTWTHSPWM